MDGFNLNAVDYLVKPFGFDRFSKAVNKYLALRKPDAATYIMLQVDKKSHKVDLKDIICVEAMGDYAKVMVANDRTIACH